MDKATETILVLSVILFISAVTWFVGRLFVKDQNETKNSAYLD